MMRNTSEEAAKAVRRSTEVCQELDIQPYVLKFWEAEFPQLSRRIGPKRLYGPEDFRIAQSIKRLLQDDGLTLAEAREEIAGQLSRAEFGATATSKPGAATSSAMSSSVVAAIVDDIEAGSSETQTAGGDAVRAQLAHVIQERDAAEGREARARREIAELQSALVAVRDELSAVRGELASTAKQHEQVTQLFEQSAEELRATQQQLGQAQAVIEENQQSALQLTDQLAASRAEVQTRSEDLERSKSAVNDLRAQLEREQKTLHDAKARTATLSETQARLDAIDRELKAEKTRTTEALNQTRALQDKLKSEGEKHGRLKLELTREIEALLNEARGLSGEVAGMLVSLGGEARGGGDQAEPAASKAPGPKAPLFDQRKPAQP